MARQRHRQLVRVALGALVLACATLSAAGQDSRVCAGCHRSIWETYRRTGMGRSFYRPSPEKIVEDFTKNNTYYHKPSDSYFTMLVRDGKYFQRRYQLDSANQPVNVLEKQIDYVMGSGNHARTYLARSSANTLIELPLGWYAEKGGYWAMNPGYDRPKHDGFRRPITYDCMFCHNAYPRIPAGHEQTLSEPVYEGPLPEGIDCQRCHGSGARHAQLAGTAGTKPQQIRDAIVNPARLSAARQMEICMVCHLETTSFPLPNAIQRFERSAFSYRPGEPLADFLLNFDHEPAAGRQEKFEIVSAAYRLRRSACFLKSNGRMLCTTCHNPHSIPRGEDADRHYTAMCRQCHAETVDRLARAGRHPSEGACAGCHMPKRRTEDVVHVAVTDHLIQRRAPGGDLLAERAERQDSYRGRVVLYYPETLPDTAENHLALAVAQVMQGSNFAEGIPQLSAAIEKYRPDRPEYDLQLADALQQTGQIARALPLYREAVRRNPKSAVALQKLGSALRRSGQLQESAQELKQAIAAAPRSAIAWHELGLANRALGNPTAAVADIRKALELDPELPEAQNNLGSLLFVVGDRTAAESSFREAIRIRPDYADAEANLASLLSGEGRIAEARTAFETALRLNPADAATHYNFAGMLGRAGHVEEARRELEASLRANPEFADAHLLLGDLLLALQQAREAVQHYRDALQLKPDSGRAHLGLGAALIASGDRAGAMPHLQKAAADPDAAVRERAVAILKQIGNKP